MWHAGEHWVSVGGLDIVELEGGEGGGIGHRVDGDVEVEEEVELEGRVGDSKGGWVASKVLVDMELDFDFLINLILEDTI